MSQSSKISYNKIIYSVLTIFGVFIIYKYFQQKELIKDYEIIVVTVNDLGYPSGVQRRPKQFYYDYYVNGKKYHGNGQLDNYKIQVGDTIYIKISKGDPSYSEPIYDSLLIKNH